MRAYPLATPVADDELIDLGDPRDLGGRVLTGAPRISARIDYQADGMTAGIFQATTGTIEIHFPYTEHGTVIEGEVVITDESGASHAYGPGDSFLIRQGQVVLWEVRGERMRKSFFNVVSA